MVRFTHAQGAGGGGGGGGGGEGGGGGGGGGGFSGWSGSGRENNDVSQDDLGNVIFEVDDEKENNICDD
ncbi:unnamed protein product [Rotaria sp. Silwood1]|nr:unnamed protein product [Rotaria sp. Silwood1]CAF1668813.1 unnamed protein product [Rotaria sp. Silwood1]